MQEKRMDINKAPTGMQRTAWNLSCINSVCRYAYSFSPDGLASAHLTDGTDDDTGEERKYSNNCRKGGIEGCLFLHDTRLNNQRVLASWAVPSLDQLCVRKSCFIDPEWEPVDLECDRMLKRSSEGCVSCVSSGKGALLGT